MSDEQQRAEWEEFVSQCHAKGFCEFSGMSVIRCQRTICDCFETPEGAAEIEQAARMSTAAEYMRAQAKQPEVGKVEWFRNSYGVITDGAGWEISKDDRDGEEYDGRTPWSLWHHGEYVANYATVTDAKADALPLDCSKCADYELARRDAGLGVGHIWYRVACPAYTTYNPADCTCGEVVSGSD